MDIILYRHDLQEESKDKPVTELDFFDFKQPGLIKSAYVASNIIFKEKPSSKKMFYMKSRGDIE